MTRLSAPRDEGALRRAAGRRRLLPRAPRALRPTRAGWCFFAITFGVGFAALNTGNNLLYMVLSLMLAFLALSGFLSELALRGVRVERQLPREVFAGASNRITLTLRNTQSRGPAYALVVEDLADHETSALPRRRRARRPRPKNRPITGRCFALRIEPGGFERRTYAWTPHRRGFMQLHGFRVSTRFPFALFVKSLEQEAPAKVLVYPNIGPLRVASADRMNPERGEIARDAGRDGAQVSGLREFVAGDSAQRIHWRSSLRRGALLVGEIEDESDAEVEVLLRTRADARDDTEAAAAVARERFEQRVCSAASEIVSHTDAGRRVALRTDFERFEPGAGAAQRTRLLGFLALVEPASAEPECAEPDRPATASNAVAQSR